MDYTWDFWVVWEYREVFLRGALVTMRLTAGAVLLGLAVGLLVGMAKNARLPLLRGAGSVYVEVFRSTPVLVQLVWIYYSLPILTGVQLSSTVSVTVGLGLHAAAYFGEIFRAGINSVDKGQMEAAKSIGMRYGQAMRRIILPQAIRRMVPPFMNEFATLIKLTTLGSVLAVYELLHESNNLITNTFRPLEVYTALAAVFAVIIFPIVYLSRQLELRWGARS